jgi:hypothetical protein
MFKPPVRVAANFINPVDPERLNGIRLGIPQWKMPLNYQDVELLSRYSLNITPMGNEEDPSVGKGNKLTKRQTYDAGAIGVRK